MENKFYIRLRDGKVAKTPFLQRFLKPPGHPYVEVFIPACCNQGFKTIIYPTFEWDSSTLCSLSTVTIIIDGVPFLGDPLAPSVLGVSFGTTAQFINAMNAKYGEKLLFTAISPTLFSIQVKTGFEEFTYLTTIFCIDPN